MGREREPKLGSLAPGTQREQATVTLTEHGLRLDQAVAALCPSVSRTKARKIIGMGGVHIGQRRCRVASRKVRAGDHLTITWHDEVLTPNNAALMVLYEDDDVALINKPSGQHVQGTELGDVGTLAWSVVKAFGAEARLAHRIDAPASGLMIVGKTRSVVNHLMQTFRNHDIEREYVAITKADVASGPCNHPLVKDGRLMRVASSHDSSSLAARTDFKVIEVAENAVLVGATLFTGRTHQVRVHLAASGAPILGDRLYGGANSPRLCLHALRLKVSLGDGRQIQHTCEPGPDFWRAGGMEQVDLSISGQS